MKPARIVLAMLIAFALVAAGTLPGVWAQEAPPRTYYDTLNLDTPEDAAQTFVEAFQRLDFPTVMLVMSPTTQRHVQQHINLLRYNVLFDYPAVAQIEENFPRLGTWEQMDLSYFFDVLMLIALDSDGLLIDLRGQVEFTGDQVEVAMEEGEAAIDLLATIEGIDGLVRFRMVLSPQGRWRVRQVILPEGDEEQIPWSVPPPVQLRASSLYQTPCDGTTPDQPEVAEDEPVLIATPSCGDLPESRGDSATEITLQGLHFQPGVEVELRLFNPDTEQRRPFNVDEPVIAGDDGTFTVTVTPPSLSELQPPVTLEILAGQTFRLRDN